jgi:hypothetical protein
MRHARLGIFLIAGRALAEPASVPLLQTAEGPNPASDFRGKPPMPPGHRRSSEELAKLVAAARGLAPTAKLDKGVPKPTWSLGAHTGLETEGAFLTAHAVEAVYSDGIRFGDAYDDSGKKVEPVADIVMHPKSTKALFLVDCAVSVGRKELNVVVADGRPPNQRFVMRPVTVEGKTHVAFAYRADAGTTDSDRTWISLFFEKGESLQWCDIYKL